MHETCDKSAKRGPIHRACDETASVCECVCPTSALGVAGKEDGVQQILLTNEADLCHVLLPAFGRRCRP